MESKRWRMSGKYVWIVFLVGLFIGATVPLVYCNQPHMESALGHLQSARGQLVAASPNKGGHRERAIELIDRAIVQVNEGIRFRP